MHVSGDYVACKWRYPPFVTLILNKYCTYLRLTRSARSDQRSVIIVLVAILL